MKLPCRSFLFIIAIVLSLFCFGERSFAASPPRDFAPLSEFVYLVVVRQEAPPVFFAQSRAFDRLPITARVFPKFPSPMAYHPQPAHC